MKKFAIITLILVLTLSLFVGCNKTTKNTTTKSTTSSAVEKAPDLTGEWVQKNSNSKDSYQAATIKDNTIEIYWITDGGDKKSLYWAGSFEAPKTAETYSFDSKNDKSKTESSLMASSDDTKKITYKDGVISYEASALGTTATIKLQKK